MKTYLVVIAHQDVPGIRQCQCADQDAAGRQAVDYVNEHIAELRANWAKHGSDWVPDGMERFVPQALSYGDDWREALDRLQLIRLGSLIGDLPSALETLPLAFDDNLDVEKFELDDKVREAVRAYVADDDRDPEKYGFPMVWIEEPDVRQDGADMPAAEFGGLSLGEMLSVVGYADSFTSQWIENGDEEGREEAARACEIVARVAKQLPALFTLLPKVAEALGEGRSAIDSLDGQLDQLVQYNRGVFDDDQDIAKAREDGEQADRFMRQCETALEKIEIEAPPAEGALYSAILSQRAAWQRRQAPAGQEMNDDRDQEEADTVVDVLDDVVRLAGLPQEPKPVRVILGCEGGIVQGGWADGPVDLTIFDYDTEGADAERVTEVPQDDGTTVEAYIGGASVEIDAAFVERALLAVQDAGIGQ